MSVLSLAAVSAALSQLDTLRVTLQGVADQITADDNAAVPVAPVAGSPAPVGALTDAQIEQVATDAANAVRTDLRAMAPASAPSASVDAAFPPPMAANPIPVTVAAPDAAAPVADNPGAVPGTSGVGDVIAADPTANVG